MKTKTYKSIMAILLFASLLSLLFAVACEKQSLQNEFANNIEQETEETEPEAELTEETVSDIDEDILSTETDAETEQQTEEQVQEEDETELSQEEILEAEAAEAEAQEEKPAVADIADMKVDEKCGVNNTIRYGGCKIIGSIEDNKVQFGVWNVGRADIEGLLLKIQLADGSEKTDRIMHTIKSSPDTVSVIYFDIDLNKYADDMNQVKKFYYYPIDIREDGTYWCKNQIFGFNPISNCKTTISMD